MTKAISLCGLLLCAPFLSQGQPNVLMQQATAFQSQSDRNLQIMSAYLMAGLAGATLNPNLLMQQAAAFQGSSDRDLQIMQTYLLSQTPLNSTKSVADMISSTRIGTTRGVGYKQNIPTNFIYIASGEGIVRSIEYTSDSVSEQNFDARTNRTLRIYTDAGTINFGAASLTLPAGNLLAEIPLWNIMDCKYWPLFKTNSTAPLTFATRYVGWVEVPALSATVGGASHYTYTLRYPMPFTNGIAIIPWDNGINSFTNTGFSFVNYELGTLPTYMRDYRLRTFHTLTNSAAAPIILNYTGAGEVASLFTSSTNDPLDQNTYWEGVWYQKPDGLASYQTINGDPFGCAGGEDMFNNGYFFDGAANSTWDWGTRYIHADASGSGDAYYVENYRHFSGSDSHRWLTNQLIYFSTPSIPGEWDSLCIFYGK